MRTPVVWDCDPGNETNSTLPGSRRVCQALVSGDVRVATDAFVRPVRAKPGGSAEACLSSPVYLFLRGLGFDLLDHNRRGPAARIHLAAGRYSLSGERQQFFVLTRGRRGVGD